MSPAYVTVDVFTDTPLPGNQLAVPEDGSALSDDQMQRPARDMNHSGQLPAIMTIVITHSQGETRVL